MKKETFGNQNDEISIKSKLSFDDEHDDEDSHEEHVDEGWLVSYADMMTLLFGLFVLLYSMSKLDKQEAQKLIESTQEKFGKKEMTLNESELSEKQKLENEIKKLLENQEVMQAKVEEQKKAVESFEKSEFKINELQSIIESLKAAKLSETKEIKIENEELKNKLKQLAAENKKQDPTVITRLEKKLEDQKIKEKELERKIASIVSDKKDAVDFEKEMNELKKQLTEKDKETLELKRKISSIKEVNKTDFSKDLEKLRDELKVVKEKELNSQEKIKQLSMGQENQSQIQLKLDEMKKKLAEKDDEQKKLNDQLMSLKEKATDKIQERESKIAELNEKLALTKRNIASVDEKETEIESLKEALDVERKQREESAQRMANIIDKNKELEAKINSKNGDASSKSFLAVFINWPTEDHDIDLVVKDPSGKKFDFKNRKHNGHPGLFALDTRRGPGAELWQSDRIIPGIYTASYSFYNQYGNANPAKVLGTIYTPKGSVEIRPVDMKIDSKRQYEVQFKVESDGEVKIIKSN